MIKVIDDWYITVDSYPTNYTVRRGEGNKGKNGKWLDKSKGHFNSLDGAVKEIRRLIIAERFENSVGTLETALDTITEVDARFEKLMEKIGV